MKISVNKCGMKKMTEVTAEGMPTVHDPIPFALQVLTNGKQL